MNKQDISLELKPQPDGYGFIYGEMRLGDELHRVNIMPPADHWDGDIKLGGYEPHETDWILYIDGEEVGRAKARCLIEDEFRQVLQIQGHTP